MSRYVATDSIWMGTEARKHQKISHHITGMVSMSQRGNEVLYSCGPPEPYYVRISQCKFGGLIDCDWKEMACCKRDIQDQAQRCCGPWKNMDWPALVVLACFGCIAFWWLVLSTNTTSTANSHKRVCICRSGSFPMLMNECCAVAISRYLCISLYLEQHGTHLPDLGHWPNKDLKLEQTGGLEKDGFFPLPLFWWLFGLNMGE